VIREYRHLWRCAGCASEFELTTRVKDEDIMRSRNPAPMIATEKMLTEREAAQQHARKGCRRPV
jgi:hypothetical protein